MNNFSKLFLLVISVFIISCSSDDDNSRPFIPDGDFANGTLVLNEGGFSGGSSVSFIPNDLNTVKKSIFEDVNQGEGVGVFPQSIFFEDDKAYIISNQSNLISVVNRFTFELIDKIDSGLNRPRFGTTHNGKAYVTNQADFSTDQDDFIAVIDLETLEVEDTIIVGAVAEEIVSYNGDIYILNSAFGEGTGITIFSTESNSIVRSFAGEHPIDSMRLYNGIIYTSAGRFIETYDFRSSTFNITISENPAGLENIQNLRVYNDKIYFTSGSAVYSAPLDFTEDSAEMILDYGGDSDFGVFYGFEINNDQIFVADAGDFDSNGTVFIYTISGDLVVDFQVGLSPNNFYFQ